MSNSELGWFKSSRSGANNACVEVRVADDGVDVRDSKHPDGPVLKFSNDRWREFVRSVPNRPRR